MLSWLRMRGHEAPVEPPKPDAVTFDAIMSTLVEVREVGKGEPVHFTDAGACALREELIRLDLLAESNVPGVYFLTPRGMALALAWGGNLVEEQPTPARENRRGAQSMDPAIIGFVHRFRTENGRDPSLTDMSRAFPGIAASTAQRYRRHRGGMAPSLRVV